MPVTNDNVILYVYLMADYMLNRRIMKQSKAFVRGFTSIISPQWLRFFSAPELQRLIAGDTVSLGMYVRACLPACGGDGCARPGVYVCNRMAEGREGCLILEIISMDPR